MKPAKDLKIGSSPPLTTIGKQAEGLLLQFRSFLLAQQLTQKSIKNYVSDVRRFLATELADGNDIGQLDAVLSRVHTYKSRLLAEGTPLSTINRHLASLRQFSAFAQTVHQIGAGLDVLQNVSLVPSAVRHDTQSRILEQFRQALERANYSDSTVDNYLSDTEQYLKNSSSEHVLAPDLAKPTAERYLAEVKRSGVSTATLKRRATSIRRFYAWAKEAEFINKNPYETVVNQMAVKVGKIAKRLRPLAFFERSSSVAPDENTDTVQRKNYLSRLYHSYSRWPASSYIHLSVLVLFVGMLTVFGYEQIFKNASPGLAFPSSLTSPNRVLSFQGRLTDVADTPIVIATNVKFRLFNDPVSGVGDGAALWASGTCSIDPDQDGIFNTLLGSSCGSAIPSSVFSENVAVYLEVEVAGETLTPRQQIATVAYALNSETLQGYPASASAVENTVPIFNNSGQLLIGLASPTIRSTSGTFAVQGNALTLSTNTGTNGAITIAPDGTGVVNVIGGTTTQDFINITNANLTTGTLVKGTVGNDNTGYKFLSFIGGSSPSEKFSVNALGGVNTVESIRTPVATISATYSGATPLLINGTGGQIFSISNGGVITLNNLATGAMYSNSGVVSSEAQLSSSRGGTGANLSSAAQGAVPYFSSTGVMSALAAGTNGYILMTQGGGANPIWQDPAIISGGGTYWTQLNGALFPKNSTVDAFIGGQSTTSAKFAFLNVNSGVPVASVSGGVNGAAYLTADGILATTARQTLSLGGTNTGALQFFPGGALAATFTQAGSLGIGTATPGVALDVVGSTRTSTFFQASNSGYSFNGDTNTQFGRGGADILTLVTGGIEAVRVDASQNVGIGTTTATARLDIAGSASTSGTLTFRGTTDPKINMLNNESFGFRFSPGGDAGLSEKVTFLANGNVGIATTAPSNLFSVGSTSQFQVNSSGAIAAATGIASSGNITFSTFSTNGGLLYTNGTGVLTQLTSQGSVGNCLVSGGAGAAPSFGSCASGNSNYWTIANGSIYPVNATLDAFIGGISTASAKFAFINVNNGTPVASVSAGTTGASYLTANGILATTARQTLTLGGANTGAVQISPAGTAAITVRQGGNVGIGTIHPAYKLNIADSSATTVGVTTRIQNTSTSTHSFAGFAAEANNGAVLTQIYADGLGSGALGTAGGYVGNFTNHPFGVFTNNTERIRVLSGGNVGISTTNPASLFSVGSTSQFQVNSSGAIAAAAGITSSGNITFSTFSTNGGLLYTSGAGLLTQLTSQGSSGNCLLSNGAASAPSFGACPGGSSSNYWTIANGSIYPVNATLDAFIGGISTASAKFAFINVNSGTPTASVSAGVAGGTYLTATGTLNTTARQTLTLGGTNGGAVQISPAGTPTVTITTAGLVGIGTTNPFHKFEVHGGGVTTEAQFMSDGGGYLTMSLGRTSVEGSLSIANSAAQWSTLAAAGDFVVRSEDQDLILSAHNGSGNIYLTTGSSDTAKMTILNNGNVGIGTTNPSSFLLQAAGHVGPNADASYDLGSTSLSWRNLYVTGDICFDDINCASAWNTTNHWQLNNKILAPGNTTHDLAIGGNATSSAKFQVFGATGNATTSGTLTFGGAALANNVIAATSMRGLQIGNSSTGNIIFSGGNIGIGTTAPMAALDIASTANAGVNIGNGSIGYLKIGGSTIFDNGGNLTLTSDTLITTVDDLRVNGNEIFDGAGTRRIAFDQTQNNIWLDNSSVGIGFTTLPNAKLDVRGTASAVPVASFSGQTAAATLVADNSGAGNIFVASASGANRFTITNQGRVGIGTTTPGGNLSVVGSDATSIEAHILNNTATGYSALRIGVDSVSASAMGIQYFGSSYVGTGAYSASTANISSYSSGGLNLTADNAGGVLRFFTGGSAVANERGRFDANGNLGIGTTGPSSLLHLASTSLSPTFAGSFFDWSPASAATTSSDLYRFKIGANGNTSANILNVLDDTTSLFNVSESTITSALPHAFTAAGDVSIAYDLQFTNQTASFLKSNGPLTIESGETFENNNLTFKAYGSGQYVFDSSRPVTINRSGAITIQGSAGGWSDYLHFLGSAGTDGGGFGALGADDALTYLYAGDSYSSPTMVWRSGNVGIGTTAPQRLMQLGTNDGVLQIGNQYSAQVSGDNCGRAIFGSNFYISSACDYRTAGDHASYGYAGLEISLGTLRFYGTPGSTTADATVTPTANMIINSNGNVGIGSTNPPFRLDVADSQASTYVAQIRNTSTTNTADGLLVRLDVGTTASGMYFVGFSHAGTIGGKIQGSGTDNQVVYSTSGTDYAEYFPLENLSDRPDYGDVIAFTGSTDRSVGKGTYLSAPIGVVTDTPGFVGNGPYCQENDQNCDANYELTNVLVGLVGQISTKVSTANGDIQKGDYLTSSATHPGVAVKAVKAGAILGRAMEDYSGSGIGKIVVLVRPSWYDPDVYLTDSGDFAIASADFNLPDPVVTLSGPQGDVSRIGVFAEAVVGKIRSGFISTSALTTDSLTVAGQSISDYITQMVNDILDARDDLGGYLAQTVDTLFVEEELTSPVANIDTLNAVDIATTTITPAATEAGIAIRLDPDLVSIVDTTNTLNPTVVTQFDNAGNATFSGEIDAAGVNATSARVAYLEAEQANIGTLFADNIDGLDDQIAGISQSLIDEATASGAITYQPPQDVAELINSLLPANDASTEAILSQLNAQTGKNLTIADVSTPNVAIVEDLLTVRGLANFTYAEFSTALTVGSSLVITPNSIETPESTTLYVQPSGSASVNFLAGILVLDPSGLAMIEGTLYVSESIYSKDIHTTSLQLSPLDELSGLPIQPASASGGLAKLLALYDENGNVVSSIDASGSAAIRELIIAAPGATSSGTIASSTQSNSTAGTSTLPAFSTEVAITNPNVADNTLIYLTPLSNTFNEVLYVKTKTTDQGFTVAINTPLGQDVTFNYWLIKVQE